MKTTVTYSVVQMFFSSPALRSFDAKIYIARQNVKL